jgi:UDP-N-acetylmuramoylalanine-D-glutamate ligase
MLSTAGRRVLVGGNIGVPLSSQVDQSTDDTVHVVEASSFQLETTVTFRPWIAALLNFSPDHLDRHPDEAAYGRAKARIFANQAADDWAVARARGGCNMPSTIGPRPTCSWSGTSSGNEHRRGRPRSSPWHPSSSPGATC